MIPAELYYLRDGTTRPDKCRIWTGKYFPDARAHLLFHFANSAFEMADEFTRNTFALQQSVASSPFGETLVASFERKAVSHETWLIIRNPLNSLRSFFLLLNSKLKRETTYVPSCSMRTTSKDQSEHTQSLYYTNIRQFFTCLNHIPPIKFHFAKLYFAPSRFISS